ncbi:MAG: hypothetical protein C0631_06645, partial [Sedimenticola sp.]
ELAETYDVTLSNVSANVSLVGSDLVGVGTILDEADDTPPVTPGPEDTVYAVISGPVPTTEGDLTGDFTVNLVDQNGNAVVVSNDTDVTVVFGAPGDTAESGDYVAAPQTVTISAGNSSATLTVQTNDDVDFDNETFTASISNVVDTGEFEALDWVSGAAGQSPSTTADIIDDDVAPTIRIDDVTVNEDAGTATFTVSLSHATTADVTFDYATSDNSATAGSDYTAIVGGSGSITAGSLTTTIDVAITDDLLNELAETYDVTLSNVSANVSLVGSDLVGVGTILDDDVVSVTSVVGDAVYEGNPNTFTVTLSNESETATDVTLALTNGTAGIGVDTGTLLEVNFGSGWVPLVGMVVSVPALTSSFQIRVPTVDDAAYEGDETYILAASTVDNVGAPPEGTGTILDLLDIDPNLSVSLSDEGLPNGLMDTTGTVDTTDAASVTGNIWDASLPTDPAMPVSMTMTLSTDTVLSSNGGTITWTGDGTGTDGLVDATTLIGTANGSEAIRLVLDSVTGDYAVTLSQPIDHPIGGNPGVEDVISFSVNTTVTNTDSSQSGVINVSIEDDMPVAEDSIQFVEVPPVDTNIMITLDVSGSMGSSSGVNGLSRLDLAKQSISNLLDGYDQYGDISVMLVTFSTYAQAYQTSWMTVDEAKAALVALTANGGTNYDEALGDSITAFDYSGKIAGAQNVAYFISDGEPTYGAEDDGAPWDQLTGALNGDGQVGGTTSGDEGIQALEEGLWTTFLNANFVNAVALGMGSGVSQANLNPIAYDGSDGVGTNTDGVVVTDLSQLDSALQSTISIPAVSGSILTGGLVGSNSGFGADGDHIKEISIDGSTYSYNPDSGGSISVIGVDNSTFDTTTNTLTINTAAGAILAVDMDSGEYEYTPAVTDLSIYQESIDFLLTDNDGDSDAGNVLLNVTREPIIGGNFPPIVRAQTATVSEEGLVDGLPDTTGTPTDATDSVIATGSMEILDLDADPLTISLTAPTSIITSNGQAVSWSGEGTTTLIGSAGGSEVIRVQILNDAGDYQVTLSGTVDHQTQGVEDVMSFDVGVTANDGTYDITAPLTVQIEDDSPTAVQQSVNLVIEPVTTNLSIIVDISSSMSDTDLALTEQAIDALIDSYDALGSVNVNVVQFYGNGNIPSGWVSASAGHAIALDTTRSGTDIEQGLREMVEGSYSGNQPAADQDIMYFFGDGNTYDAYQTDFNAYTGITDPNVNPWGDFVTSGQIDKLFSYSVNTSSVLSDIVHLADNGENLVSQDAVNISDISGLQSAVNQTAGIYAEGSLIQDATGNAIISYGADGGHITEVTIAGTTVQYDSANVVQDIPGSNGVFTLNFDTGAYTYRPTDYVAGTETVTVSITDGDGDTLNTVLLDITIAFSPAFPKTITVGDSDASSWDAVDIYGFTETQTYKSGSDLDIANLPAGTSANIGTQLGVVNDRLNFFNGNPDSSETLVIHIKDIADSAVVSVGNWGNSDELHWEVFASDGTSNGSGVVGTNGLTSVTIDSSLGVTGDFEYIAFRAGESGSNSNADFSITEITFNIPGKIQLSGTNSAETLTGTDASEIIDGMAGADVISAGSGYDEIVFDSADSVVDGGAGFDTLIVPDNDDLDFSAIANGTIQNIEQIDLIAGNHDITNLTVADVLDMTDSDNLLEILGDAADSVSLSASEWQATGGTVNQGGHQFNEYQDAAGTVTLLIESTVDVSII